MRAALLAIWLVCPGCAWVSYEHADAEGRFTKFRAVSFFADDRISKLAIDKSTKTTSQGLGLGEASSEVSADALEGFTRGIVEGVVQGLKTP